MSTLVIARDCQPGDALCSLPAICGLAEQNDKVYLAMTCEKVREIADFPGNVINVLDVEPEWRSRSAIVQMLGVGAAIGYRFHPNMMHPIHSLMAFAGLDVDPRVLPQPKIKLDEESAVSYDILLAPWAKAKERTLNQQQSIDLYCELRLAGYNVAFAGAAKDAPGYGDGFYDRPFGFVANLMRAAKVVVTADSFPGRLAHAAGIGERHIILDSGATPPQTQCHPGATMVRGQRGAVGGGATWNLTDLRETIERVMNEQSAPSAGPA